MKKFKFHHLYDVFNMLRISHVTLILFSVMASVFDLKSRLIKVNIMLYQAILYWVNLLEYYFGTSWAGLFDSEIIIIKFINSFFMPKFIGTPQSCIDLQYITIGLHDSVW